MLHGWNRSIEDLRSLAELLAEHFDIRVIDLPGFGKTPPPPEEGWDTSQYGDLVLEYIKKNDLKEITLLGHSFGGRVSLRIACKEPELVKRLILVDSHGLKPKRGTAKKIKIWLIAKLAKFTKLIDKICATNLFKEKFAKKFGSPDYLNAGILKNTFIKTIKEDQTAELSAIKSRTLLLWGSDDTETPLEMGRRFKTLIKNSKLIVLEGKGHSPYHGVGAHLCAHHIISFLQSDAEV